VGVVQCPCNIDANRGAFDHAWASRMGTPCPWSWFCVCYVDQGSGNDREHIAGDDT
jgi:hypothetical protein